MSKITSNEQIREYINQTEIKIARISNSGVGSPEVVKLLCDIVTQMIDLVKFILEFKETHNV